MKIEFILIGVIAIVFLVDFIVKRRKKGLIIPKHKTAFSKKKKITTFTKDKKTELSNFSTSSRARDLFYFADQSKRCLDENTRINPDLIRA